MKNLKGPWNHAMFGLLYLGSVLQVHAGHKNWVGGAAGNPNDWNTAANWSPAGVPAVGDDATVPASLSHYPILTAPASSSIHTLHVNAGGSMTVASGGMLVTTAGPASVAVDGALAISGGTLGAYQDLTGAGTVSMSGGTMQVGHDFHLAPSQFSATGGTVEWTGQVGNAGPGGFPGSGPGNSGVYQFFNVLVDGGVNPGFDNQANHFSITGNWTNNGTVTLTRQPTTVTFGGNAVQIIAGLSTTTFTNLTISNVAGVELAATTAVDGTLTLSQGILSTGPNAVELAASGTVSGGGAASYVDGYFQKNFATGNGQAFNFPLGDAAYAPLSVGSLSVTVAGGLVASSTAGEHPGVAASGINPASDANRYWTLEGASGIAVSSCKATFNFLPGDLDAGANAAGFVVRRYSNGVWFTTSNVTATASNTAVSGLTVFGDFAVGNPRTVPFPYLCSMKTNACALGIFATPGATCSIMASTDLQTWTKIGTANLDANGACQFQDVNAHNFLKRFYRVCCP